MNVKKRSHWTALLSVAVATSLILSGCSSGKTKTASSGSGQSSPAAPTGKPINIGLIQEESGALTAAYLLQWGVAAKAAADYINKELGGFGGRPVKIDSCDSQSSTAGALTCANKMVADNVDFVTGISLNFGANGIPVLAKAGIPTQMLPISTQDFSSPNSFPLSGGSAGAFPAEANYATKKLNAKKGLFTAADSAPAQLAVKQLGPFFQAVGGSLTGALVPATSADLAPTIAKITSSKPDIVISSLSGVKGISLYEGLQAQGWDPKKILGGGNLVDVDNFLSKVQPASAIEGSLFEFEADSFDDSSNPDVAVYQKAMAKYSASSGRSEYAELGFSALMTNYNLAKKIGFDKFDGATMTTAYNSQPIPVFAGFKYDKTTAPATYPQVGNSYVRFVRYQGGKLSYDTPGWINAETGAEIPSA